MQRVNEMSGIDQRCFCGELGRLGHESSGTHS
jgi:hypothetical protein